MTTYPASYCPYCGSELGSKRVDGRDRQYCADCERVVWRNPVPCASVAVVGDDGVLVTKRGIDPGRGDWAVPGGHLEVEEPPAAGAARELQEETGIVVDPSALELADVFDTGDPTGKRVVSTGYVVHVEKTTGEPTPGPEVQAVDWVTPTEFSATDGDSYEFHGQRFETAWQRLGHEE